MNPIKDKRYSDLTKKNKMVIRKFCKANKNQQWQMLQTLDEQIFNLDILKGFMQDVYEKY